MATGIPDPYPEDENAYVFGPIIGPHDVDQIIYEIIHTWQVSYLREVARRAGEDPDELVPFRSWRVSHELEKMPEDQTPTLIIQNAGLEDQPLKRGTLRPGKTFYACYRYRLGCLVTAKGKKINASPRANKVAKMYATAVRSILIQKRDDRNILGMLDWVDDLPGPLSSEDDRTIAMWVVQFNVEVPNSAAWATGPQVPDDLPAGAPDPPLLGTVTSIDVTIEKTPTDEGLPPLSPPIPVPPDPPVPPPDPIFIVTIRGVRVYDVDRIASSTPVTRTIPSSGDITDISNRPGRGVMLDRVTPGSAHTVTITNRHPTQAMSGAWYDSANNFLMSAMSLVPPGSSQSFDMSAMTPGDAFCVVYFGGAGNPFVSGDFEVSVTNPGGLVPPP